jgi:hypothetical protein
MNALLAESIKTLMPSKRLFAFLQNLAPHIDQLNLFFTVSIQEAFNSSRHQQYVLFGIAVHLSDV